MKKTASFYDNIADHYEEDYTQDPYWKLYNDITWHNIKSHLPKKKMTIIDVGGGTGYWARRLAKLGHNVVVTDISKKMLSIGHKKAKKANLHKKIFFQYADIVDMPHKDERFDMVLCQGDPLSYCINQRKAIKELVRIAKPKAKIIASVDNFFATLHKLQAHKPQDIPRLLKTHKSNIYGVHPQYNFTPEELKALFQNNSCQVLSLIGKPVFIDRYTLRENPSLLTKLYKKSLALELKFNSCPSLVGKGGHLEIVVQKQ